MVLSRDRYRWFYDNVHHRYYDALIRWCFLPFGGEKRARDRLLSTVGFAPGERILDMCCGTGGATIAIAVRAGPRSQITGVDLSAGQIGVAQKRPSGENIRFQQGDVTDTGFPDGHFDKVFITHAIHEMPRELRMETLCEARRVLRPGGELVVLEIDDPPSLPLRLAAGFWLLYWLPFNFETPTRRDMFRHGLVNEVRDAGFAEVRKTPYYGGVLQVVQALAPGSLDRS